jgi:hypothetical protein
MANSLCLVPGCRSCTLGFRLDFGPAAIGQVAVVRLPGMCPPCAADWDRWLDYKMPPAPISMCQHGNTARGVRDRLAARAEDYYATIRWQQSLIRKQCAEQHTIEALVYAYPEGFRYELHTQIPMPYPCCKHCHHPRHPQFTGHPSPCYHCGLEELARQVRTGAPSA